MVYTVFYKTSSFAGYCFLNKNSIHPKRRDVFNFKHFEVTLVKFQICSFIAYYPFGNPHASMPWDALQYNAAVSVKKK